jgi:hypothetical protein
MKCGSDPHCRHNSQGWAFFPGPSFPGRTVHKCIHTLSQSMPASNGANLPRCNKCTIRPQMDTDMALWRHPRGATIREAAAPGSRQDRQPTGRASLPPSVTAMNGHWLGAEQAALRAKGSRRHSASKRPLVAAGAEKSLQFSPLSSILCRAGLLGAFFGSLGI